ncbi:hypothetical protein BSKO_10603 [Bryopsis sp. KO-2023]|nr:hypothetical protein BSKO_10603 [Bryopsis sp. KO-2023]
MLRQKRKAKNSDSAGKRQRSVPFEADGYRWLGEPVLEQGRSKFYQGVELEPIEEFINEQPDNFKLFLKDVVEIIPRTDEKLLQGMVELPCGQQRVWLFRIDELLEKRGEPFCRGQWFYTIWDTIVKVKDKDGKHTLPMSKSELKTVDCQQIYLAEDNTDYEEELPLGSIKKPARVEYVVPGRKPVRNCEYWYSMSHSLKNFTFRDHHRSEWLEFQKVEEPKERVLQVLEVFCGCGGLSFIAGNSHGVKIKPAYAVDISPDATATYRANHHSTNVFCCDAEIFVRKCKLLEQKYEEFGITDELCRNRPKEPIADMVIDFEMHPSKKKITRFLIQRMMYESKNMSEEEVKNCLVSLRTSKRFPLPADVDVVAGGPPCQDVSSANLHKKEHSILESDEKKNRNYQLQVFFKVIAYFRPSFTLMENVQHIFVQDDGMYVKYAIMKLLALGYQSRLAVLSSNGCGAPQNRWRCFLWGAISGKEDLPSFPKAAFEITSIGKLPGSVKQCRILPEEERASEIYPTTTIWDAFEDLPPISNYSLLEVMPYKSKPYRPYQFLMRRSPPAGEPSKEERLEVKNKIMKTTHMNLLGNLFKTSQSKGNPLEELGRHFYHDPAPYDREVLNSYLDKLPPESKRRQTAMLAAEKHAAIVRTGLEVKKALDEVRHAKHERGVDLLSDHRPDTITLGRLSTVKEIPKAPYSGLKDLPGIVNHRDGSICSGNLHLIQPDGTTRCRGGGTCKVSKGTLVHYYHTSRGVSLPGCKAQTRITPTGSLLAPRWAVVKEFKDKRNSLWKVYGRFAKDMVSRTLRAHGHGLCGANIAIHPMQDRCVSVRECARIQGFPDYYVFVGTEGKISKPNSFHKRDIISRLCQIGNSVSPLVASSLGICLALAASGKSDPSKNTILVVDPVIKEAMDGRVDRCYINEIQNSPEEVIVVEETEDELFGLSEEEEETLQGKESYQPKPGQSSNPPPSSNQNKPPQDPGPSTPPTLKEEPMDCDLGPAVEHTLRVSDIKVEVDGGVERILVDDSVEDTLGTVISIDCSDLKDDAESEEAGTSVGTITLTDSVNLVDLEEGPSQKFTHDGKDARGVDKMETEEG